MKKTLKRALLVLVALVVVLVGIIVYCFWLSGQVPVWWAPPEPNDPQTVALSEAFENATVSEVHRVREASAEAFTLALPEQSVNAWLASRMPGWAGTQASFKLPADFDAVFVDFESDEVRLGVRFGDSLGNRVFSIRFKVTTLEEGRLEVRIIDVAAGRLRVPLNALLSTLEASIDGLGQVEIGKDDARVYSNLKFKLADDRELQVVGVISEDGVLRVECVPDP